MIESGSSLGCFRTCPKLYGFKYVDRLESPNYSQALGYGNFIHLYRAAMHSKSLSDAAKEKAFDEALAFEKEQLSKYPGSAEQIKADKDLAIQVVGLWWEHWNKDESMLSERHLRWQEVEREWGFDVTSGGNTLGRHVGKSDGLVRQHVWDKMFLYELKTASDRGGDSYLYRLNLDYQINSNLLALKREGRQVSGVLYDIIWKPALRRKVDRKTIPDETLEEFNARIVDEYRKNPSEYFQRVTVNRSVEHLEEYELELVEQFKTLQWMNQPYRNPNACLNYNQTCQFFDLCMDPAAQEQRSYFKQRNRKLPELSEEIQNGNRD